MNSDVCCVCGKNNLVPGSMQSTGTLHFRPSGVKFMVFRTADVTVHASMCGDCGAINLRGDLEKLHLVQNLPGTEENARPASQATR